MTSLTALIFGGVLAAVLLLEIDHLAVDTQELRLDRSTFDTRPGPQFGGPGQADAGEDG